MFVSIKAANLDRAEAPFALYMTGCFGSRAYVGDAAPKGNMDRNTQILIIVCSIIGVLLLVLIGAWLWDCRRRRRVAKRREELRQRHHQRKVAQDQNQPKPAKYFAEEIVDDDSNSRHVASRQGQQRDDLKQGGGSYNAHNRPRQSWHEQSDWGSYRGEYRSTTSSRPPSGNGRPKAHPSGDSYRREHLKQTGASSKLHDRPKQQQLNQPGGSYRNHHRQHATPSGNGINTSN